METDRKLVLRALGVARTLTYNEEPQGAAKQVILELCRRLDPRAEDLPAAAPGAARVSMAELRVVERPATEPRYIETVGLEAEAAAYAESMGDRWDRMGDEAREAARRHVLKQKGGSSHD